MMCPHCGKDTNAPKGDSLLGTRMVMENRKGGFVKRTKVWQRADGTTFIRHNGLRVNVNPEEGLGIDEFMHYRYMVTGR